MLKEHAENWSEVKGSPTKGLPSNASRTPQLRGHFQLRGFGDLDRDVQSDGGLQ